MKITILDYGAGNLTNISTFVEHRCGLRSEIVAAENLDTKKVEVLLIPGVGHYQDASLNLINTGAREKIKAINNDKKPIIGICLGAQLLLKGSEESEIKDTGIGILDGYCIHLSRHSAYDEKIPRVGWEELMHKEETYYFVHSYCMVLKEDCGYIINKCKSDDVTACVRYNNVLAMQFHPEKSGKNGKRVFLEFIEDNA